LNWLFAGSGATTTPALRRPSVENGDSAKRFLRVDDQGGNLGHGHLLV
jgi:hypothetical protein